MKFIRWVLAFVLSANWARCASNQAGTLAELMNYMSNYGYLDKVKPGENRLRTSDEIRKAIEDLQSFLNIRVTGELDESTKNIIRQRRCGVPDVDREEDKKRRKRYAFFPGTPAWKQTSLTWRLNRNSRSIRRDDAIRDLDDALRLWSDASSLTFRRVEDQSAQVDIEFSFEVGPHGDGYSFDGTGNTLAHAFPPSKSDIGGDVHLDEDETWEQHSLVTKYKDRVSVFMAAAHELGHSFGLSHSNEKTALMYPLYQGHLDLSGGLPYDDVYGIQTLYGAPEAKRPVVRLEPERQPATRRTTTTRPVNHRTRPSPHWPHTPNRQPTVPTTQRPVGDEPRETEPTSDPELFPCRTAYDAVATVRGDLFIFKGKKYWRMIPKRDDVPTGPHDISNFWAGIPGKQDHVDAVYERPQKGGFNVVFFIGNHYWMFDGTTPIRGHPRPLAHLGLPRRIKKIDAAFVWAQDGNTYFFSQEGYWRFDEALGTVEHKDPKPLTEWPGLPGRVDAAIQWNDGAYFFKDLLYWEIGPDRVVGNQKLSAVKWMKCSAKQVMASSDGPSRQQMPNALNLLIIVVLRSFSLLQ